MVAARCTSPAVISEAFLLRDLAERDVEVLVSELIWKQTEVGFLWKATESNTYALAGPDNQIVSKSWKHDHHPLLLLTDCGDWVFKHYLIFLQVWDRQPSFLLKLQVPAGYPCSCMAISCSKIRRKAVGCLAGEEPGFIKSRMYKVKPGEVWDKKFSPNLLCTEHGKATSWSSFQLMCV